MQTHNLKTEARYWDAVERGEKTFEVRRLIDQVWPKPLRARTIATEMIDQEFHCSFEAPLSGSYYGRLLSEAERARRIASVPWEPTEPVETWWDLGISDETAIWFVQQIGREVHLIDYYEASGEGLEHFAKYLAARPYPYREHLWPHHAAHRELGTGRSRKDLAENLGVHPIRIVPPAPVADGIQAVRSLLPRCWFDGTACAKGLEALRHYARDWDDRARTFRDRPRHDWASHAADAFRIGAMGIERPAHGIWSEPRAVMQSDPLNRE